MTREEALAFAREVLAKVQEMFAQWQAGTLPAHMYRKPPKPRARSQRARESKHPDSVRRPAPRLAPQRSATPKRRAPNPPKFLRPLPFDSPIF